MIRIVGQTLRVDFFAGRTRFVVNDQFLQTLDVLPPLNHLVVEALVHEKVPVTPEAVQYLGSHEVGLTYNFPSISRIRK